MASGTPRTREYYEQFGWKRSAENEQLQELNVFGKTEDGPLRQELYARHLQRIQCALRGAGDALNILECGCGGNPELQMLREGDRYTGLDFSATGLEEAEKSLRTWGGPFRLELGDLCRLPFSDGEFDAVYCAHVLYHIEDPSAQVAALREMARVLRPGGVAVLNLANPRPLLFPVRLGKRLVADMPVLGSLANRVRKKSPLPYHPMSINWYKRQLGPFGTIEILTGGIPTTWFSRNVTEYRYPGKLMWQAIRFWDARAPRLSASLGNYFLLILRKN